MDPVTHITAGVLLGQTFRKHLGQGTVALAAVAAWLPDIDNFLPGGPEIYLRHHRGLTHSWAGGLLLALILAGLFFFLRRRQVRFAPVAALCIAGVFMHIFLDLVTSYGTQIWLPFSDVRAALSSVFIIDPVFTLALISLAIIAAFRHRPSWALAGLLAVFAYPAFNFGIKSATHYHLKTALRDNGRAFDKIHVTSDAFSPWFWKVILEDDENYSLASYRLFQNSGALTFEGFQKADRRALREMGAQASLIGTFEWFAAFPVIAAPETSGDAALRIRDLRFISRHPLLASRRGAFILRIEQTESGYSADID